VISSEKISTSVYKFVTWYHEYGHASVAERMKSKGKTIQEPRILSVFTFIVRWQNRKSIYHRITESQNHRTTEPQNGRGWKGPL